MTERHAVEIRLLTSRPELQSVQDDWHALHARAGQTVFQTHEWVSCWWEAVSSTQQLRVFTCWVDRELVGVLPGAVQQLDLGLRKVFRFRIAGEYGVYGEYTPFVDPAHIETFVQKASEYLAGELKDGHIDLVDFASFRAGDPIMAGLADRLKQLGLALQDDPTYAPRTSFTLPETWEAYLQSLKSRERRELKRDTRSMENLGVTLEIVRDRERGVELMERLITLHTELWKRRGAGGHFKTDRHFAEFIRSVTPILLERDSATAYALVHGGEPIVLLLNFHTHTRYSSYVSGRNLDHEFSASSPGRVLFGHSIRDAIERGFHDYDFLGGAQPYKLSMGAQLAYYGRIVAWLPGFRGMAGRLAFLLLELRFLVQIKFYRHRVLPKLNKTFRKPLRRPDGT